MRLLLSVIFAASLAAPASAQCNRVVHVVEKNTQGTFTGTLEKHVFPGPPNFEDVAKGDQPRPTYLLRLDESICADDGEVFADMFDVFDSIHVSVSGDGKTSWPWLSAHVGQKLTLTGEIFAANNASHYAPLVMLLPKTWKPPR